MDEQLLLRFLSGHCSEEELQKIDKWIKSDQANAEWLFEIERIWSLKDELIFSEKEEIEIAFKQLMNGISHKETAKTKEVKKKRLIPAWFQYAAALLIISLLSIKFYQFSKQSSPSSNTIEVPKGQRVALTLSDGTRVWLNSDSHFTYPTDFSNKERTVTLDGEGYFEVVKNPKVPFIVYSANLNVKVLGTKFNMKAYQTEEAIVKLKEGKVEVSIGNSTQRVILHPNQQVSFSRKNGLHFLKNADVKTADNWTAGELTFVGETLEEISRSLERKFDITIQIRDESLKNERFTCRVEEGVGIGEVLNLLKNTRKLDYKFENAKVIIIKTAGL